MSSPRMKLAATDTHVPGLLVGSTQSRRAVGGFGDERQVSGHSRISSPRMAPAHDPETARGSTKRTQATQCDDEPPQPLPALVSSIGVGRQGLSLTGRPLLRAEGLGDKELTPSLLLHMRESHPPADPSGWTKQVSFREYRQAMTARGLRAQTREGSLTARPHTSGDPQDAARFAAVCKTHAVFPPPKEGPGFFRGNFSLSAPDLQSALQRTLIRGRSPVRERIAEGRVGKVHNVQFLAHGFSHPSSASLSPSCLNSPGAEGHAADRNPKATLDLLLNSPMAPRPPTGQPTSSTFRRCSLPKSWAWEVNASRRAGPADTAALKRSISVNGKDGNEMVVPKEGAGQHSLSKVQRQSSRGMPGLRLNLGELSPNHSQDSVGSELKEEDRDIYGMFVRGKTSPRSPRDKTRKHFKITRMEREESDFGLKAPYTSSLSGQGSTVIPVISLRRPRTEPKAGAEGGWVGSPKDGLHRPESLVLDHSEEHPNAGAEARQEVVTENGGTLNGQGSFFKAITISDNEDAMLANRQRRKSSVTLPDPASMRTDDAGARTKLFQKLEPISLGHFASDNTGSSSKPQERVNSDNSKSQQIPIPKLVDSTKATGWSTKTNNEGIARDQAKQSTWGAEVTPGIGREPHQKSHSPERRDRLNDLVSQRRDEVNHVIAGGQGSGSESDPLPERHPPVEIPDPEGTKVWNGNDDLGEGDEGWWGFEAAADGGAAKHFGDDSDRSARRLDNSWQSPPELRTGHWHGSPGNSMRGRSRSPCAQNLPIRDVREMLERCVRVVHNPWGEAKILPWKARPEAVFLDEGTSNPSDEYTEVRYVPGQGTMWVKTKKGHITSVVSNYQDQPELLAKEDSDVSESPSSPPAEIRIPEKRTTSSMFKGVGNWYCGPTAS